MLQRRGQQARDAFRVQRDQALVHGLAGQPDAAGAGESRDGLADQAAGAHHAAQDAVLAREAPEVVPVQVVPLLQVDDLAGQRRGEALVGVDPEEERGLDHADGGRPGAREIVERASRPRDGRLLGGIGRQALEHGHGAVVAAGVENDGAVGNAAEAGQARGQARGLVADDEHGCDPIHDDLATKEQVRGDTLILACGCQAGKFGAPLTRRFQTSPYRRQHCEPDP